MEIGVLLFPQPIIGDTNPSKIINDQRKVYVHAVLFNII